MIRRVYDAAPVVGEFVARLVPGLEHADDFGVFRAIGFADEKGLIGGAVFNHYTGFNANLSFATTSPRMMTKGNVKAVFEFAFNQMGCVRLTAMVGKRNRRSRKLVEGLGFRYEGNQERGHNGREDLILYGMTKERCKWI